MNERELQAALGVTVDGKFWGDSQEALLVAVKEGRVSVIPRVSAPVTTPEATSWVYPRQSDVAAFYGPAGALDCTAGRCTLPFAFPLAWDADQRVTSFACHRKVAADMTAIFAETAKHYGEAEFRRLRLDQFGGCYNYRVMRGGSAMSMHAWGIAVDLDPTNNQLKWGRDKAAFARSAYEPFWTIVEAHGATSLGRRKNFDWMHFQFAGL